MCWLRQPTGRFRNWRAKLHDTPGLLTVVKQDFAGAEFAGQVEQFQGGRQDAQSVRVVSQLGHQVRDHTARSETQCHLQPGEDPAGWGREGKERCVGLEAFEPLRVSLIKMKFGLHSWVGSQVLLKEQCQIC